MWGAIRVQPSVAKPATPATPAKAGPIGIPDLISPCGETFLVDQIVTYQWSPVSGAINYVQTVYNTGSGGSVQLPPTTATVVPLPETIVGSFSWDVYSTGPWWISDKSMRCYFTIVAE
jgi:hypothetical protein